MNSNNINEIEDTINKAINQNLFNKELENNNEIYKMIDINLFNMHYLPNNVSISTMGITCSLCDNLNISNIFKYITLDINNIVAVKSSIGIRYIPEYIKNLNFNKNSKKNFFNQMTIIINIHDQNYLNIKLFKNGSLQITGCKDLKHAFIGLNKLIIKLKEKVFELNNEILYINNINTLNISKFKINLINCNFQMNYNINRDKLYSILINERIQCRISTTHACVNIKYKIIDNIYVSIFIFQTGNIIITGAKCFEYVKLTYRFIIRFLNKYKKFIIKKDYTDILNKIIDNPEYYIEY